MRRILRRLNGIYLIAFLLVLGCRGTGEKGTPVVPMSQIAQKGKAVFEAKKCGRCHSIGKPIENPEMQAPDLTTPFLANDSMFVVAHLKFVDETKMPAIQLTDEEIKAVSHYIANLHASLHATVSAEKADTLCAVCYAPVLKSQAREKDLWYKYLDRTYYFECADCKKLFAKAPEAYRQLLTEYTQSKEQAMQLP